MNARKSWNLAWRTARHAKRWLKNGKVTERDALFSISEAALRDGLDPKALAYVFDKALDGSSIGAPRGSFRYMEQSVRVVLGRFIKWRPEPVAEHGSGVFATVVRDGVNTVALIESPSINGKSWRIENSPTGYDCRYWNDDTGMEGYLVEDYADVREFSSMNKRISDGLEGLVLELHEEIGEWISECWLEV